MSVYNIKSTFISNRDASPPLLTNPEEGQGQVKAVIGAQNTSESGASVGAAGSAIKLVSIPSNARVQDLQYAIADLATSSLDIAVWYPTTIPQGGQNAPAASLAGTLISSSAFTGALSGVDSGTAWTSAYGTNLATGIQNAVKPLWSFLGLSSDPELDLDLGFSVRVAVTTNGYVGLRATYID